ncbi:CRISPR-associated protein Cas6 [Scytonema hofmannii PCC 7110]|uniref:CRISPR-associated protein Cas6 n=1 Tax=Scytonema hofmannii PCC 7110 TaxID=128403 RepID=A0A139XGK7_9CYAN|nr:CRISPR-associated endoribonuclease Cas6 [Scytonema hofmannii]KYC43793.1 CRISPR-associated protein Cas6 [Scytonema hofmannii PCC 7110]
MPPRSQKKPSKPQSRLKWSPNTELIGLVFELVPQKDFYLYAQYTIGLHAWFLDQVRSTDPELSAYLHDGESEKPFTISALDGELTSSGRQIQLLANTSYHWYVTALSSRVQKWMAQWVKKLPSTVDLRDAPLTIASCQISHPPTTYAELLDSEHSGIISLKFLSPTSFRRKGHHLPLPVPVNVFHSYLRRWNDFSGISVDQDAFLTWVDDNVLINRCQVTTVKVLAGKKGAVTGFTGSIELSLTKEAAQQPEFQQLFYALGKLAIYCGTGHKTTFGLGQTRLGWSSEVLQDIPDVQSVLAKRIEDLVEIFRAQRKRTGGERADEIASKWATILARREMGESLQVVAQDLDMPYETVKTYAKLARRALKEQ